MKRFYLVLWVLVLLATPFYFFGKDPVQKMLDPRHLSSKVEGGVPQVSDFLMLVLMGSVFCAVGFRVRRSAAPAVGAFAWFVAYVCAVDAVWALALEDLAPLKNMLFYIYNLLL